MKSLLTVDDVARRLGSSKSLVYQLSSSGRLRRVKIGQLLRFREEDVEDFIDQHILDPLEQITI